MALPILHSGYLTILSNGMRLNASVLILKEIAPYIKPNDTQAVTEPHLIITRNLKEIEL